ncbi:LuxR C-terminal-related transcriptional regulator [Nocardioides alcanivorans]|uniref:LuxR C-terminal-related transcriptional regulator n=1 Tax=Nocardioides alcanivorans TaxID=2897352 RepID=UPI002897612E|nr:LuxR C-terminal-related transcriptional regulator [Nocardioides alcanivorans]
MSGRVPETALDPVLDARLAVPVLPAHHVDRPRLIARLDSSAEAPITLVSAPAGSGKTVLAAAWAQARAEDRDIGWVSFEAGDESSGSFWPLVLTRLRRSDVRLSRACAHDDRRFLAKDVCAALAARSRSLTLVLDGFEIADRQLAEDLEFVLGHCDERLRLVMLTRADPLIPLPRHRLRGSLVEIRARDLAFTTTEATQLLRRHQIALGEEAATKLVDRTRGWAAGLRFAMLTLNGSAAPEVVVERIVGDAGNIAEFLMSEVLSAQTAETRSLLLATSIVDLLRPGLIEELGGPDASRRLASLARAGMLIEELPDLPGWYCYHPFLRDLLRAELRRTDADRLIPLQRRAASWYARHDLLDDSVAMEAAAGAWATAAQRVVEVFALAPLVEHQDSSGLVRTFAQMPTDAAGAAADLVRAALALGQGGLVECAQALNAARSSLRDGTFVTAVGPAAQVIDAIRATAAREPAALELTTAACTMISETGSALIPLELTRLARGCHGVSLLRHGHLEAAYLALVETAGNPSQRGSSDAPVPLAPHLALASALLDRPDEARRWAAAATGVSVETDVAEAGSASADIGTTELAAAAVALAWVRAEQGPGAELEKSPHDVVASHFDDPLHQTLICLARARLACAHGDHRAGLDLLLHGTPSLPAHLAWVEDLRQVQLIHLHLIGADLEAADRAVAALHAPLEGRALLARGHVAVARGDWTAVRACLASLPPTESAVARTVAARVLEAELELHRDHPVRARLLLDEAFRLTPAERLWRPLHEAPPRVRALLASGRTGKTPGGLPASRAPLRLQRSEPVRTNSTGVEGRTDLAGAPAIPLTPKEREVLGHLAELLTTDEIAVAMFVSVNTVRTHVRHILRKLGVSRRNQAVRRARTLRLLDGEPGRPVPTPRCPDITGFG